MADNRVGVNHRDEVIIIMGIKFVNQASCVFRDWVVEVVLVRSGSKEENRSVIIRVRKILFSF